MGDAKGDKVFTRSCLVCNSGINTHASYMSYMDPLHVLIPYTYINGLK